MRKFTLQEVVRRIMNAKTPAQKAHATRALQSYAATRSLEIGSTPTQVIAGVRAVVTKRRKKLENNFSESKNYLEHLEQLKNQLNELEMQLKKLKC